MDLLDLLLDHDQWATARLLDASGGLTDATCKHSSGFRRIPVRTQLTPLRSS